MAVLTEIWNGSDPDWDPHSNLTVCSAENGLESGGCCALILMLPRLVGLKYICDAYKWDARMIDLTRIYIR